MKLQQCLVEARLNQTGIRLSLEDLELLDSVIGLLGEFYTDSEWVLDDHSMRNSPSKSRVEKADALLTAVGWK